MAKIAKVARKENLTKIGMRSFLNKAGAPIYTVDSKRTLRRGDAARIKLKFAVSACHPLPVSIP